MNLLVTGANGFIGSGLCKKVLDMGGYVRGIVRPSTYRNTLPSDIDVVPVEEIGPLTDWSNVMSGVDTVVHLAARVHVINHFEAQVSDAYRSVNVAGTERLARIAAVSGIRRLIYISTVKVNGEGKTIPYTEKDKPEPMDPYAASKWEAEKVLHKIAGETGLEVVVLRPPLVYGPGVKANFLRLLKGVECGIPLPLASVNNRRSLIYSGNLVDAVVACIEHPKAAGNTYLVSDGEDVSIPELIRRISFALGRPARFFPFPPVMLKMAGIITGKSAAIDRLLGSLAVDCSEIRRELDWQVPFSMEQGLKETATWYLKRKNISRKDAKAQRR
jgi:nucleoside-diphosphate-sugar epimerase